MPCRLLIFCIFILTFLFFVRQNERKKSNVQRIMKTYCKIPTSSVVLSWMLKAIFKLGLQTNVDAKLDTFSLRLFPFNQKIILVIWFSYLCIHWTKSKVLIKSKAVRYITINNRLLQAFKYFEGNVDDSVTSVHWTR